MTYETLWRHLTGLYDVGEAKAIVRWVLDVRFGLSMADILCGKIHLATEDQNDLEKIMHRLESGEPVQYVIGVADFCGRQFHVEPGVLIPRPETEELCQWITGDNKQPSPQILDIGTGSGCIAITLALEIPEAIVTAWDISDTALRIASKNARHLNAPVTFEHHDILNSLLYTLRSALSLGLSKNPSFHLIVSNPPYIINKERDGMANNVLDYEPHTALFAPDENPIIFYQRIGDYAWQSLNPGGKLYFELNPLTATDVCDYLQHLGFEAIELRQDQFGKQRFLKATKI